MTLFAIRARFSLTAFEQGGVLWKRREGKKTVRKAEVGERPAKPRASLAGSPNLSIFNKNNNLTGFTRSREFLGLRALDTIAESLILAQNERWRRVLSMQVERDCPACWT